jgi:hypothetical protein
MLAVASLMPKPTNNAPTPVVAPAAKRRRRWNWPARNLPPKISAVR